MKQSRRKELRTNELSIYLQQLYESASRHSTYIIGGVVVVVGILVVGLIVQRNRLAARQQAWNTYYSIQDQGAVPTQEVIDQARNLAAEQSGDGELYRRGLELEADLCYGLAITLQGPAQRDRRMKLLMEAKEVYEKLLQRSASQPEVAHGVRLSLASTEESLLTEGQGSLEAVRQLYQQVIDGGQPNPFKADAQARLDSLSQRMAKLEIIATRPAEPATSGPAAATRPAVRAAVPPPPIRLTPTLVPKPLPAATSPAK